MGNTTLNCDPKPRELFWYQRHGKYLIDRIAFDSSGQAYVVGDWNWHRLKPLRPEYIEERMAFHGVYK